jgi:hypothetical protein
MCSEPKNILRNPQFRGWEILRDAPEVLLRQLPTPATGRYVIALDPPGVHGFDETLATTRRERLALVWRNAKGREVMHDLDVTCFLLMGCRIDATWLPEGWSLDVIPAGWTLRHLEHWFEYALNVVQDDDLNNNRGDIPSGSDKSPCYLPTPRGLVAHAHLIVRHMGLPNSPLEPRGLMDRAGCVAELRDVLAFFRRMLSADACEEQLQGAVPLGEPTLSEPHSIMPRSKPRVNARMLETIRANPEAMGWNSKHGPSISSALNHLWSKPKPGKTYLCVGTANGLSARRIGAASPKRVTSGESDPVCSVQP